MSCSARTPLSRGTCTIGRLFTLLVLISAGMWLLRRVWPAGGVFRPPAGLFSITYRHGEVADTDGVIPRTVYDGLGDVARDLRLDGVVRLAPDGELLFSKEIPDNAQQQMRNTFFATRTF